MSLGALNLTFHTSLENQRALFWRLKCFCRIQVLSLVKIYHFRTSLSFVDDNDVVVVDDDDDLMLIKNTTQPRR